MLLLTKHRCVFTSWRSSSLAVCISSNFHLILFNSHQNFCSVTVFFLYFVNLVIVSYCHSENALCTTILFSFLLFFVFIRKITSTAILYMQSTRVRSKTHGLSDNNTLLVFLTKWVTRERSGEGACPLPSKKLQCINHIFVLKLITVSCTITIQVIYYLFIAYSSLFTLFLFYVVFA